jgi:DNA-binding beta-propeller fold protein YncE
MADRGYRLYLAIDTSGNIFVVDEGNNRIQKFDSNGNFITKWGTEGTGNGQFDEPTGIAIDSSGNVYVVDRGNSRIQVFALQ